MSANSDPGTQKIVGREWRERLDYGMNDMEKMYCNKFFNERD
jgi:hypothetical protein